ncbi:unnamed protein product [Cylindrotheca closterium]|uniref:HMG box domain-containing protein n=1 Tax=Cylindrotheca closterium TaxID=2856 RepID=A0AAD2GCI0_9STRA|nr:unnamed protein product [Cylindrotheca closterium]
MSDGEEPVPTTEQPEHDETVHGNGEETVLPNEEETDATYTKDGTEHVVDHHMQEEEEKRDESHEQPKMELRIEIRHEEEPPKQDEMKASSFDDTVLEELKEDPMDAKAAEDLEYIRQTPPTTKLENVLLNMLKRKDVHIARLTGEVTKLKQFISKRKQTYKRKRKDEGAPTRALSAYNIFVQDRFATLAKQNEAALKSADSDAQLKRVPPANLVAKTGNEWKDLPAEEKAKYQERAKSDRKRYDDQMAQYQPPDKQSNRKRNKTGYNMFFSAHVLRLKQSELGVPSERGSVARLVGTAWKQLSAEEKQYYEREADKHNGMNPVEKDGDEDDEEEVKRQQAELHYMHPSEMHMHGGMPPMHPMHQAAQHDPRHYSYPPHMMYGQPAHAYYDYHSQSRHHQGRSQGYGQGYPQQPFGHEQRM